MQDIPSFPMGMGGCLLGMDGRGYTDVVGGLFSADAF